MAKSLTSLATLGLIAALALAALVGCQSSRRLSVPIQGDTFRPDLSTDVDVANWNGTVTVLAESRYRMPQVLYRARRGTARYERIPKFAELVRVEAASGIENGRRVLRVRGLPAEGVTPDKVELDLIVRVARAEDVRIRNVNGEVRVKGWEGALDIANGAGGQPGGNVQVWTQQGIRHPIAIATSAGNVLYKSGPGTAGAFDLWGAGDASAQFEAQLGIVTDSALDPTGARYRGVIDGGTNPITLRSERGTVRAEIIANAGTSGPDDWDGWPDFTTGPRWTRALTGNLPEQQAPHQNQPAPAAK